jgi:hypothetical protein
VIRLRPVAAVAAAVTIILAGCGGSHDALAPRRAITGNDERTARAIGLTQDDVPAAYRAHGLGHNRLQCEPDLSSLTVTGDDGSAFVTSDGLSYVVGTVTVFGSTLDAEAAFAKITAAPRRRCLLGISRRSLRGFGGAILQSRELKLPPTGGDRLGFRLVESWIEKGTRRIEYVDDVYLRTGRAFTIVQLWRYGGRFSAAAEARLIARLASRAVRVSVQPVKRTRPGGNTNRGG